MTWIFCVKPKKIKKTKLKIETNLVVKLTPYIEEVTTMFNEKLQTIQTNDTLKNLNQESKSPIINELSLSDSSESTKHM